MSARRDAALDRFGIARADGDLQITREIADSTGVLPRRISRVAYDGKRAWTRQHGHATSDAANRVRFRPTTATRRAYDARSSRACATPTVGRPVKRFSRTTRRRSARLPETRTWLFRAPRVRRRESTRVRRESCCTRVQTFGNGRKHQRRPHVYVVIVSTVGVYGRARLGADRVLYRITYYCTLCIYLFYFFLCTDFVIVCQQKS